MGEAKKRVEAYQRAIAAAHATIYDHHNPVTVKTAFEAAQKTDIKRPQDLGVLSAVLLANALTQLPAHDRQTFLAGFLSIVTQLSEDAAQLTEQPPAGHA